ncbi:hypothetical protein [Streptomyces chiangmaiensis]|uniref:Uncharacterized protein n=1 Tax=Streptomyces chiangmaiensis TaxID=766497 RepID=A0ABU7FXF4_9ACTN|nr:hypothetical protein [Streptomyces chiangmaiensis]MED7828628.1 hypothetical protein [Streptomyces chiangmaiensis]
MPAASSGGRRNPIRSDRPARLALVAALADHWGCALYPSGGRTVRDEILDTATSA